VSKPTSLRSAAESLGMSRRKLLRLVRDGLPATRKGESVFVDVAAARQWIGEHGDEARPAVAPVLHPADPRFRERTAAAKLKMLQSAIRCGSVLNVDHLETRVTDEILKTRAALLALPAMVGFDLHGVTAKRAEALLIPAVEETLSNLKADDPREWPAPRLVPAPQEDDTWMDSAERNTLPLLMAPDPRHAFAVAAAEAREAELMALEESALDLTDALKAIRRFYTRARKRIRAIPSGVFFSLPDGANAAATVCEAIEQEVYDALAELSGTTPQHRSDHFEATDFDSIPFEELGDSNGREAH
jgi:hypothetical protein